MAFLLSGEHLPSGQHPVEYFAQYYRGTLNDSNWEDITSELYG